MLFKKPMATPIPPNKTNDILPEHSYDMAILGKQTLVKYCNRMMQIARLRNDLRGYEFYKKLGNLVTSDDTGLMLGSFLFEARLVAQDPYVFSELEKQSNLVRTNMYDGDTVEHPAVASFKHAPS